MSTDLIRRMEESLQAKSLTDLVNQDDNVMLLIDTSSSMDTKLRGTSKRYIDALREAVTTIKGAGHVPMIAFGGPYDAQVRFVDAVPEPDGGTPLHVAIPFAKEYGATRVVVISDGAPDLPEQCMIEAQNFGGQIDVVYVGDAGDMGSVFLDKLAQITGGKRFEGSLSDPKQLAGTVIGLLMGEVEKAAPIQGAGFTSVDPDDVNEPDEDEDSDDDYDEEEEDDTDEDDDDER